MSSVSAVSKAMNFILGQDSKIEARNDVRWNKKVDATCYQDVDYDNDDDFADELPWPSVDASYCCDVRCLGGGQILGIIFFMILLCFFDLMVCVFYDIYMFFI